MTTHFSILAWKIPRTEEPGRLQSMGSQRVRHDWVCTRLVVQWLRLRASKKGTWVWSLVRELRFYMPRSAVKTNKPQLIKKKKKRDRDQYLILSTFDDFLWLLCLGEPACHSPNSPSSDDGAGRQHLNGGKQKSHQFHSSAIYISDVAFHIFIGGHH